MNNATTITTNRAGKASKCVESATYDRSEETLEIVFVKTDRAIYTFRNVTGAEWDAFAAAPSLGVAFNRMFYGRPASCCTVERPMLALAA